MEGKVSTSKGTGKGLTGKGNCSTSGVGTTLKMDGDVKSEIGMPTSCALNDMYFLLS